MSAVRGWVALLWLICCQPKCLFAGNWLEESRALMGTKVHVEVEELEPGQDAKAKQAIAAVFAEFERLEAMMSPYLESSALSLMNQEAYKRPVVVPNELFEVLEQSLRMSELSGGAFDVTFASVGRYYDYRAGKRPDTKTISDALPAINYRHLLLNAEQKTVRYLHPGVYVDLGGIAKGYAVDRAIEILLAQGFKRMMVGAGGDSRLVGDRGDKPWIVGIKSPEGGDRPVAVLPLADVSISTSGDYERFFEADGVRYHHIIDPKTGDSSRAVRSVTILGDTATLTDGLSTSVFVLGLEPGLKFINGMPGVDAIIIDGQGQLHYSESLQLAPPPVALHAEQ